MTSIREQLEGIFNGKTDSDADLYIVLFRNYSGHDIIVYFVVEQHRDAFAERALKAWQEQEQQILTWFPDVDYCQDYGGIDLGTVQSVESMLLSELSHD